MNADSIDRRELRSQYDAALSEYRFQVDLNWRRSEYFFVLNIGVLVAAVSLFSADRAPRWLVSLLFLVGALLAVLSILANKTQHGYYTSARDLKSRLEKQLGLEESALATTPGMGSRVARLGKVRTFLSTMLVAIAIVDLAGFAVLLSEEADGNTAEVGLVIHVRTPSSAGSAPTTVALSLDGELVATRSLDPTGSAPPLFVPPGRYHLWSDRPRCNRTAVVSAAPLQTVDLTC